MFGPAPCCYCPLVAFQLELHAVSSSAAELGFLFYLQWRLFYCHQLPLPEQQEVWVAGFRQVCLQPPVAWAQLLSLVFSLPDTQTQVETELNQWSKLAVRLKFIYV